MLDTKERSEPKQDDTLSPEDFKARIKSEVPNLDERCLVTQDTAQREQMSFESALGSPNVERELDSKVSISNHFTTNDFAHGLLEEQCKQNQRMQKLIKQQESALAVTLPELEVSTFQGNPMDYWSFVRAFENLIERKTMSESARLYYLVQYTTGEVKELVKSCLVKKEDEGCRICG